MLNQSIKFCKTDRTNCQISQTLTKPGSAPRKSKETFNINEEALSPCTCKRFCEISITPQVIKQKMLQMLSYGGPAAQKLYQGIEEWMAGAWKDQRLKMTNRLTKLTYLQPSLIGQNFNSIQKEVLVQWKRNSFLHGCQLLWNHIFFTHKFRNSAELKHFYETIKGCIASISYLLFYPAFESLRKKKLPIDSKLFNITSVTIITTNKEWKKICKKVLKPMLSTTPSFSENFNLNQLKMPSEILNKNSGLPFQKTALSLATLSQSLTPSEIVDSLKSYRSFMVQEIGENIEKWNASHGKSSNIILQKDDILGCLIHTLVSHKLDQLSWILQYINFIIDEEEENIFREMKVDSYLTDLIGVHEYLTSSSASMDNQHKTELKTPLALISV